MAERRTAESPQHRRSALSPEQVAEDFHLPQSDSALRQAARKRRPSPSGSPSRPIARFSGGGHGPRDRIPPASRSVSSSQQTAARPRAHTSVSPPQNAVHSDRSAESPSAGADQTSRSNVTEQHVLPRQQATRSGLIQQQPQKQQPQKQQQQQQQQQKQQQTALSAGCGERPDFHGTHAPGIGSAQQDKASPIRSRQDQLAHDAQAGHSASNQQQNAGSAGGGHRSRIRDVQGLGTRDRSDIALPHRNLVRRGIETQSRSFDSPDHAIQNQTTRGSIRGREGLPFRGLEGLPQRGTQFGSGVPHRKDHRQARFSASDPYTSAKTINPILNSSHLTKQEQRRAKKDHQYESHIMTVITLGHKTDPRGGALPSTLTIHQFAVNLVSKYNRELPRGWPEMKLCDDTLNDDYSEGEVWLLRQMESTDNIYSACESFSNNLCGSID
jgi:hypothetical protein